MSAATISARAGELFSSYADHRAVQYGDTWWKWGDVAAVASAIDRLLDAAGVNSDAPVAIVLRERPATFAALAGAWARRRCAVLVSPLQSDAELAQTVSAAPVAAVIAARDDWTRMDLGDVVALDGELGLRLASPTVRGDLAGIAATVLTSGTTGKPKRVPIAYARLDNLLDGRDAPDPSAASGATINVLPLTSVGGVLGVATTIWRGRPIALMERFDVSTWAALVREHRPRRTGGPPAILRMVLDAGIPKETFDGVTCFETGSAPLDPGLALEFEATYGVPVLDSYGATEFLARVAAWTLEDWKAWADKKRGSVGRAVPGTELRVVDGRLEVLHDGEWSPTNDLAGIDDDGFVWIYGRADDVLVRGGFKVAMDKVEQVLERHPLVSEATVVALDDARLGQVPAAAVVAVPDGRVDPAELVSWARHHLAPYEIPVRVVVLPELPRNPMMKVVRSEVRASIEATDA